MRRYFVSNLHWSVEPSELLTLFQQHLNEAAVSVEVQVSNPQICRRRDGKSKGYGFIDVDGLDSARVIGMMGGITLKGRDITVEEARSKGKRTEKKREVSEDTASEMEVDHPMESQSKKRRISEGISKDTDESVSFTDQMAQLERLSIRMSERIAEEGDGGVPKRIIRQLWKVSIHFCERIPLFRASFAFKSGDGSELADFDTRLCRLISALQLSFFTVLDRNIAHSHTLNVRSKESPLILLRRCIERLMDASEGDGCVKVRDEWMNRLTEYWVRYEMGSTEEERKEEHISEYSLSLWLESKEKRKRRMSEMRTVMDAIGSSLKTLAHCTVFGSCLMPFASEHSDLDLHVRPVHTDLSRMDRAAKKDFLTGVHKCLKKSGIPSKSVLSARIPLVRIPSESLSAVSPLSPSVDISVLDCKDTLRAWQVHCVCSINPAVIVPFFAFIRRWVRSRRLSNAPNNRSKRGLTMFGFVTVALYALVSFKGIRLLCDESDPRCVSALRNLLSHGLPNDPSAVPPWFDARRMYHEMCSDHTCDVTEHSSVLSDALNAAVRDLYLHYWALFSAFDPSSQALCCLNPWTVIVTRDELERVRNVRRMEQVCSDVSSAVAIPVLKSTQHPPSLIVVDPVDLDDNPARSVDLSCWNMIVREAHRCHHLMLTHKHPSLLLFQSDPDFTLRFSRLFL